MHANINHEPTVLAPRGDGRFPRSWLTAWLLAVLFCLTAALHFGSVPAQVEPDGSERNYAY